MALDEQHEVTTAISSETPVGAPLERTVGSAPAGPPLRVSLVNDYEVIVRGLHAMLEPFPQRVEVIEHEIDGTPDRVADLALFDTFAGRRDAIQRADVMIEEGRVEHVVLYTWDAAAEFLELARSIGVSGVILKSTTGAMLVEMLHRVAAGERVGLEHVTRGARAASSDDLSAREREVLALIALGYSNREIADELFLSIDTIKTYVRRLFTKLGVSNRTQAALLAVGHSVAPPDRRRDHGAADA